MRSAFFCREKLIKFKCSLTKLTTKSTVTALVRMSMSSGMASKCLVSEDAKQQVCLVQKSF